jgi:alanine-synthesizing transaminase
MYPKPRAGNSARAAARRHWPGRPLPCFTVLRMFSRRVPSDHSANRLSAAIQRRRAADAPIIDLTESNPTRCGFRLDAAALLASLGHPGSLVYEPHPQGLASARTAVAGYYAEIGVHVDPECLFLTTGTSEAYAMVFKLLADPDEEVLVPTPGYPLLDVLTRLEGVRLIPYPLAYREPAREAPGGWAIDLEPLRAIISTRTKAIVVVSPNNPTGSYLKSAELEGLNALCRDFGLALVVDEVFSDYWRGPDPRRVRTAAGNDGALTFALNGFSKLVGLPQLKLGWIHVSGPDALARQARERLAYVTDAFLSVSAAVQHATPAIFRLRASVQGQIQSRLEQNLAALRDGLAGIGSCRTLASEGGWYSVVRLPDALSDEAFAVDLLERDGVLVHPGYFYDFASGSFLVLSLLPPVEGFREGVSAIAGRLRAPGLNGRP